MEHGRCEWCRRSLILSRRGARFCSTKCRVYWHRAVGRIPEVMTSQRRWVRADGKRPIRVDGRSASSTNSATWAAAGEVFDSRQGDGFGFMLGGGIGCYDLDHMDDAQFAAFMAGVAEPVLFVERSVSRSGFHVFVQAGEGPGWRRGGVERYTRQRFIRMTGVRP